MRAAVIHAMSMAHLALVASRGWAANQRRAIFQVRAENERARQEIELLKEEIRIKNEWMARVGERPHYAPTERMAILELRALRGWSLTQTAQRFQLSTTTVSTWMARLNDGGLPEVLRTRTPANKLPAVVTYLVQRLKVYCPSFGYARIAQVLARATLHISPTTVRRMLRSKPAPKPRRPKREAPIKKIVAQRPHDVWHSDMTIVPTSLGLWVSRFPFSLPPRWPFCWWLNVVADQYSKTLLGFALSRRTPDAKAVRSLMRRIVRTSGRQPIHFVADSGRPYCGVSFRSWCRRTAIDLQHGVIGQVGSIAFMERLIQTIKCECTRLIAVPYRMRSFDRELALYREWYNGHRPHRGLEGATPDEIHDGVTPASQRPRGQMGDRDAATVLVVGHLAGRRHLPVVSIGRAA